MSYNSLLTAENLDELQFQTTEAQKLLASQVPGMTEIPDMIPALLASNYDLGNVNILPNLETDSLVSSPSISNTDDELDLFGLQPSFQEHEQLLSGIPVGTPNLTNLDPVTYENALMSLIANNQIQQPTIPVCEPLVDINDESLLLNYPGMIPLKSQSPSPVMNSFDLTAGLNDLPLSALDQLLTQQTTNIEVPSLIPSTIEPAVGNELIDPLLIGATNPCLMNELLEANANATLEQLATPPLSPVDLEVLKNAKKYSSYIPTQSPIEIPEMDFNLINTTAVSTPSTQPIVLKSMTSPTQKSVPILPPQMYTPELENKKLQQIMTDNRITTKTNYTYVPVTKKRSNSDLKGGKLERKNSKSSQKKSVPMIKDKKNKSIQKQQVKHTFVIETPGINYGKKTSGRKRKCKKSNEEETLANLPQVPQIPCRPSINLIPPQKLSKIHARTTEDLDSLPFQCEFCPSAFSRKHDLKRHIKIHIGNTPAHKCKQCGKSYARLEALNKHEAAKECQK